MMYAVLCYNNEEIVCGWTKEQDEAVMAALTKAHDKWEKAGKLKPLGVSHMTRLPLFPDVPTLNESGLPGFDIITWNVLQGPRGIPEPIQQRLNRAAMEALFSRQSGAGVRSASARVHSVDGKLYRFEFAVVALTNGGNMTITTTATGSTLQISNVATTDTAHTVSVISSTLAATQQTTSATSWSTTTNTRAARPIAPGAVASGGTLWGAGPHTSPVTVAWEPRTRLATVVVSQTATGQTAESATDYVLKVYASDGTTLLETIETSSTSAAVTSTGNLVLDLRARRGGLLSYQGQRIPVNVIGPALLTEGSDIITTEAADRLTTE